jgi:hypothetical protein
MAGRPRGALSWAKNSVNFAADYANALIECWLGGVPIQIGDHQLIPASRFPVQAPRGQPRKERRTVPWRIKRVLCRLAIARVRRIYQQIQAAAPEIEASLRRGEAKAEAELRRRGWTDERIAAHFKRLQVARKRRVQRGFREPDLGAVLAAVNRRAPDRTLRRKAGERDYTQKIRRRKRIDVDKAGCERLRREANRDRKERARRAKGAKPRAQALSRTRPWDAEGISRRTWERRRAAAAAGMTQVRPSE